MALISDTQGRQDGNSAYGRLFGDDQLGSLFSRVHATTIRAGNELEDIVASKISLTRLTTMNQLIRSHIDKSVVFKGSVGDYEVDFVIYDSQADELIAVELKAGDTFDTKKSTGELDTLTHVVEILQVRYNKPARFMLVGFNATDRRQLLVGLKGRFKLSQLMTGIEFADYLQFSLSDVLKTLADHQQQNKQYLLQTIKEIYGE